MIRHLLERLSWAVAFTVTIALFLPWVKIKSSPSFSLAEQTKSELVEQADLSWWESYFTLQPNELRDALNDPLSGTSGFSLLLLSRSEQTNDQEKAVKMVAILGSTDTREAAVLIYAIPACVLLAACFFSVAAGGRWVFLLPWGLSSGVYFLIRGRLSETYFDRSVLDQVVGLGLWVALYGLLLMVVFLTLRLLLGLWKK